MLKKYEFEFLKSFPFDEYVITSGKEKIDDSITTSLEKHMLYNFTYDIPQSEVTISFYEDDICFLYETSDTIKILDTVRENIDRGLATADIIHKMKRIKKIKPFLKKINGSTDSKDLFISVLDGIQKLNTTELPNRLLNDTIKLKESINLEDTTRNEEKTISSYLNFQLHHAKIMLGVIIASKIH